MKWVSRGFLGLAILILVYLGYSWARTPSVSESPSSLRTFNKTESPNSTSVSQNRYSKIDLPTSERTRARTLGFQPGSVLDTFVRTKHSRLNGSRIRLTEYSTNWIILNFWASWCIPCREEMPSLERLHEKMKKRSVRLLTVNVGESSNDVRSFLNSRELDVPVIMDHNRRMRETFSVEGLPVTWILAPGPDPLMKYQGPEEWDRGAVYQLLRDLTQ